MTDGQTCPGQRYRQPVISQQWRWTFTDVTAKADFKVRPSTARRCGPRAWLVATTMMAAGSVRRQLIASGRSIKIPIARSAGGARATVTQVLRATHNSPIETTGRNFTDLSEDTGIGSQFGKGMSVSLPTTTRRLPDAFVANDTTRNFLFHNLAGRDSRSRSFAA